MTSGGFSARRLRAVARKEFIHVVRDWRSLVMAIAIPAMLILLFGYALDTDLNKVPTLVWDQSRTPQSRDLLSHFDGSPYFSVRAVTDNYRDLAEALDSGDVLVALVIPGDLARRLGRGDTATMQVIVDGSDSTRARLALNYAAAIALIYNANLRMSAAALRGEAGMAEPIELEPRAWYNPGLRSPHVIIPGILAIVTIVIAAMLTSVTVAREWEMGTMESLISTPLRAPELLLGKAIPYFVIGLADVAIAVIMGRALFDVPLRGNPALVFAMASLFLTGALFFGLMLSIVTRSQVIANQAALLGSYLPTLMLSGFLFAIADMPRFIQGITYIVPARYFIRILRGIYLKGVGLEILWADALLLALYAAAMVVVSHRKMKMKLAP